MKGIEKITINIILFLFLFYVLHLLWDDIYKLLDYYYGIKSSNKILFTWPISGIRVSQLYAFIILEVTAFIIVLLLLLKRRKLFLILMSAMAAPTLFNIVYVQIMRIKYNQGFDIVLFSLSVCIILFYVLLIYFKEKSHIDYKLVKKDVLLFLFFMTMFIGATYLSYKL